MGQKITKLLGIGLVTIGVLSLSACGAQKHADSASTSSQSSSTSSKTSSTASSQAPKKSASHQVSSKKNTQQPKSTAIPGLNLAQIQQGNFSSLQGQWQLIATSVNREDGNGQQAYQRENGSEQLFVNQNTISDGSFVLQGATIAADSATQPVAYKVDGKMLDASFSNQGAVSVNHTITFIPRGVDSGVKIDGKSIGTSQNLIQVWSSGPSFSSIYAQTSNKLPVNTDTKLNIEAIHSNNFSSLVGTWKNPTDGKEITVTNQITIKPTSSHYSGFMGATTDGPKDSDGNAEVITNGDITNGWLEGGIGNFSSGPGIAFEPLAIAPAGIKIAPEDNSDVSKDRLIVGGGQGGYATSAYYRVK